MDPVSACPKEGGSTRESPARRIVTAAVKRDAKEKKRLRFILPPKDAKSIKRGKTAIPALAPKRG
jgi:hypothetical protein